VAENPAFGGGGPGGVGLTVADVTALAARIRAYPDMPAEVAGEPATVRLGGRERAALALAVDELLDDCFQVVEAGAGWDGREPFPPQLTLLVDYLPPRYRSRYTPGFFRRLCVCLVLVAAKLADPDLEAELPGTLGEELALHALVGHARLSWAVKASLGLLDAVGERYQGSPDFDDFVEAAYWDLDYLDLFDDSLDGLYESAVGQSMAYASQDFDDWFTVPYGHWPPHPYLAP